MVEFAVVPGIEGVDFGLGRHGLRVDQAAVGAKDDSQFPAVAVAGANLAVRRVATEIAGRLCPAKR